MSEEERRRELAVTKRPAVRVGLARIRDRVTSRGCVVEVDFGKPFGGPRLRLYRPSRHAAAKLARAKTHELRQHGDAAMLLTTVQRIEAAQCFKRIEGSEGSLSDAVAYWLEQHPAAHRGKTIAIVAKELVERKAAGNRRERYVKDLGWKLDAFAKVFPGREVASIKTQEIEAWFATKAWSPVSYRSYAETLHVFFNFALSRGYAKINPVAAMEMPRRDQKEPEILTVDQARSLLAAADASEERRECLAYVAIGTFAGIRPEEIARMDWAEVDVEHRTLLVLGANAKGRDRRVVDMAPNLAAWLSTIPNRKGKILTYDLRYYRDRLKAVLGWKKWPHDVMRHSFASYHLAQHRDQAVTTSQLGHRSKDILWQHYRALVMPAAAADFWKIVPVGEGRTTF